VAFSASHAGDNLFRQGDVGGEHRHAGAGPGLGQYGQRGKPGARHQHRIGTDRTKAANAGQGIGAGQLIDAAVAARPGKLDIRVSDERAQLLETGGGVVKAMPLIDSDPFFIVNADNMWIDGSADTLRLLAQRWDADAMDALLLLVPLARASGYDGRGDFHLDPFGGVAPRGEVRVAPFVYSGIQLISKHLFDGEPVEPFSMWRAWNKALANGRLYGAVHQGLWFHVGTPASVGETEALLATA
jgi:MurNAc alpha-1-phosphate uridylyltransferase